MQYLVDVRHDPAGRISGTVTPQGGSRADFSGWLELVHLLEDRTDNTTPENGEST